MSSWFTEASPSLNCFDLTVNPYLAIWNEGWVRMMRRIMRKDDEEKRWVHYLWRHGFTSNPICNDFVSKGHSFSVVLESIAYSAKIVSTFLLGSVGHSADPWSVEGLSGSGFTVSSSSLTSSVNVSQRIFLAFSRILPFRSCDKHFV